jgi:hypothetical protein
MKHEIEAELQREASVGTRIPEQNSKSGPTGEQVTVRTHSRMPLGDISADAGRL